MSDQRLWCSGLPGCPCERHTGPSPDRRISIDPTDEAVVERVAELLCGQGGWERWYGLRDERKARWRAKARAVLSALADGDTP